MINVESGSEMEVLERLRKMREVREAHGVYGIYDIVAIIQTADMDALRETITSIRSLDKVRATQSMTVYL